MGPAAAGVALAGGGLLLGLTAQRVRLEDLAAVLAVAVAALVGAAKQASP